MLPTSNIQNPISDGNHHAQEKTPRSTVGGLHEVVQHDVTGVTIYPFNVESLAWGVLHTLRDPKCARARATKAYRVVKREYNWDRIAEQRIEVYERIVRERTRADW